MRVLVTGSAGYIGSVVVPRLREAGHKVLGYDAGWFGEGDGLRVVGDIRDKLVRADWPDVVVHLAGISNDPMGDLSPHLTYGINAWGTIDLLQRHIGARHIVISSCAVYGQADSLCDETADPNPQTTYAECKAMVDAWLTKHHFNYMSLRLGTVFGPSPNHRLDLVVNRMVYDAVTSGRHTVTGNAARPLVHVEDVASAIVWAVKSARLGIYNVVGENVRMLDLASTVANATASRIDIRSAGADTRDYMASGSKLLAAGWGPTRSVAGSLPDLITFTSLHSDSMTGFGFRHGVRLDTLRQLMDSGRLDKTLRFAA